MKLGFYGAAGEVTGSNYVLTTSTATVMIDCGLFQGTKFAEDKNADPFDYNIKDIDVIVLTHAHLDHCGRLPRLWKEGFRGKIYATPATRDLAELIMSDAAHIMLEDAQEEGKEPLYLTVDVANTISLFELIEYHTPTEIAKGVKLEFYDAGHILGAAMALIEADGKKIVFSGDIGNHPVPILRQPEVFEAADVVIMETTYGGRTHESSQDRRQKLRSVIRQTADKKGTLIIPAFAVERTQEILYEMSLLVQEGTIPAIPVFLDSPLAIAATLVYHEYPRYYDDDAQLQIQHSGHLFSFPTLRITETASQSMAIRQIEGAKVIIAGSGMMEGGRVVHHAKDYLTSSENTLLFVGYQAEGTLGRKIYDGVRKVKIKRQFVDIKARVMAIGAYSSHADQPALIAWLDGIKKRPSHVFLVHGEQGQAEQFAQQIKDRYTVAIPEVGQEVEL